jgi:hypothetical protein
VTATTTIRRATPELILQLATGVRHQLLLRGPSDQVVIGVRAYPQWDHAGVVDSPIGGIEVVAGTTPLTIRTALSEFAGSSPGGPATLVVLSDLSDTELGADVLGRFVRARLLPLDEWNAIRLRFGVQRLDPKFAEEGLAWMAEALLTTPTTSVPQGIDMLSVDLGLAAVAATVLGAEGITLDRLLMTSTRPGFATRVSTADPKLIEHLCASLGSHLGPAGLLVTGAIARGHGEMAVPAGLAARTVLGGSSGTFAEARLGDLTGVNGPSEAALGVWAKAAETVFAELAANGDMAHVDVSFAGSRLAEEWKAPHVDASDILSISFEARLDNLAGYLEATMDPDVPADPPDLRRAVARVVGHREASTDHGRPRAQRAQLAARLSTWLRDPVSAGHGTGATPSSNPLLLTSAIAAYGIDGAWVDAARRRVGEGDDSPPLYASVLQRISQEAHARRAEGNRAFASALARWTTDGTAAELTGSSVVAVEAVLSDVVAPLAAAQPILLLVLDGCGLAQFLEFADQFRTYGLQEVGRSGKRRLALAALPTVTEASRTSLLSGALAVGTKQDESRALPKVPAIAKLPGDDAVVFHHHSDLVSGIGKGLPEPVVAALGSDGPRVVAAVVNSIDDELNKGTFSTEYRIEQMGPLHALLRQARDAGRLIIVTADHGHVLGIGVDGRGDAALSGEGGERWRLADRVPNDDEVLLRGPRVVLGGTSGILAPWHDDLRYSASHGGYHGGATPDECVVPLSVFTPTGVGAPAGWEEVDVPTPLWWDLHVEPVVEVAPPPRPPKRRKAPTEVEGQGAFFIPGIDEPFTTAGAPEPPASSHAAAPWLDAVMASETYALQQGAISRGKPSEESIRAALVALHARGGVASFGVIAQATGMGLGRIPGFLAILVRLLNVDGFGVLTVDSTALEARLDQPLLVSQFSGPSAL